MKRHLRSEEFSKWLSGERTPEHEEHLRSCADCAAELANVQAPIALFRGAVREWSAQEGTNLVAEISHRSLVEAKSDRPFGLRLRFATAGAVLAVAIVIGAGGNPWRQAHSLASHLTAGTSSLEQQRAREDEALLGNIRAQVLRPVPATMQPVYNLMAQGIPASTDEDAK